MCSPLHVDSCCSHQFPNGLRATSKEDPKQAAILDFTFQMEFGSFSTWNIQVHFICRCGRKKMRSGQMRLALKRFWLQYSQRRNQIVYLYFSCIVHRCDLAHISRGIFEREHDQENNRYHRYFFHSRHPIQIQLTLPSHKIEQLFYSIWIKNSALRTRAPQIKITNHHLEVSILRRSSPNQIILQPNTEVTSGQKIQRLPTKSKICTSNN